jgi:excisionase family DNA binding protein
VSFIDSAMLLTTYSDGTQMSLSAAAAQQVYTVAELATRLRISERRAYDLIRNGEIAYACCGSKNYRVGEPAVQRFLQGFTPVAA